MVSYSWLLGDDFYNRCFLLIFYYKGVSDEVAFSYNSIFVGAHNIANSKIKMEYGDFGYELSS